MISKMVEQVKELMFLLILFVFSKAADGRKSDPKTALAEDAAFCLSWRFAVESNNVRAWRTVPAQCLRHVESYMLGGQYDQDLKMIMGQIYSYIESIDLSNDGLDGWILDVDDTCISNLLYYKGKHFGCDPYDGASFKAWALKGGCPAIPTVQDLFNKLVEKGFKVLLITGRDRETLGQVTVANLHNQGFIGYERLIMRGAANHGQNAVAYKSEVRKKLVEEAGYRLWGNVGDQWSDLQGDYVGNRTFKLPNPLYFVP